MRLDAMVSWIDILPTLVDVAGGKPPTDIDGRSFASVLRGDKQSHRDEVYATHSGDREFNVYPMRSLRTEASPPGPSATNRVTSGTAAAWR